MLKCIFSGRRYDALRMVSILRMKVLTIRDVFILNFAPVSLSVSTPRTPRVCHAFQQQATDNCRVGQTATQDMSCMQSKVCSTAQELTSTAHGILFTSSPRSQHSGIVRKQQGFSSSESALAIGGMLRMSVHSCSILSEREAYDMWVLYQSAVQLYMFSDALASLALMIVTHSLTQ